VNIVFDLDGTLIDARARLYRLFQHLAPESPLSFSEYWAFKRRGLSNAHLLADELVWDEAAIVGFTREWMRLIEAPEFLALDEPMPGVADALARLAERAELHLCTARQLPAAAAAQLQRLGLRRWFKTVLVTEQHDDKQSVLARQLPQLRPGDWMVGDTGKDMQAGRALGLRTCAVLSGFLDRDTLLLYRPDLVLDTVEAFAAHLGAEPARAGQRHNGDVQRSDTAA
jgi:phosphoglycolate phosphatase